MKINSKNFFLLSFFILSASFAEETYVNRFKLFNDFDKFLSEEAFEYEIVLEEHDAFYDNKKFQGSPDFLIKDKKLYHRGKLICDVNKNDEVVAVNEDRPSDLTIRQKDMTLCIYLPFVYYKDYYPSESKKSFSIRVLTGKEGVVKHQGKSYYKNRPTGEGAAENQLFINPSYILKRIRASKNKLFENITFKSGHKEIVECGERKELDCLKKYLAVDDLSKSLKNAKKIYGEIDINKDRDLIYMANSWSHRFINDDYYTKPYKDIKNKISLRELHRKILIDNLSKAFKDILTAEYTCSEELKTGIFYNFLYGKNAVTINLRLNEKGEIVFDYFEGEEMSIEFNYIKNERPDAYSLQLFTPQKESKVFLVDLNF